MELVNFYTLVCTQNSSFYWGYSLHTPIAIDTHSTAVLQRLHIMSMYHVHAGSGIAATTLYVINTTHTHTHTHTHIALYTLHCIPQIFKWPHPDKDEQRDRVYVSSSLQRTKRRHFPPDPFPPITKLIERSMVVKHRYCIQDVTFEIFVNMCVVLPWNL